MEKKTATKVYSSIHESSVANALGAWTQPQSGGGKFKKGDILVEKASMLVECKCSMSEKDSFSIKKEWLAKVSKEAWEQRLDHTALCFNFAPNTSNYYVINETLMKFLVEKLEEIKD